MSKKQDKIKRSLIKVYKEIYNERDFYCTGCGRYDLPLSNSHLIPRSRRSDLILEKKNITYHCLTMGERTGCHDIWESKKRHKLLDYFVNLAYIKEVDLEYYEIITNLNA